jgi:DnaJ-class molecular chaperone
MDEVISPQTVKEVLNEGMPIYSSDPANALKEGHERGNLYIKFDITFPRQLNQSQKNDIKRLLTK